MRQQATSTVATMKTVANASARSFVTSCPRLPSWSGEMPNFSRTAATWVWSSPASAERLAGRDELRVLDLVGEDHREQRRADGGGDLLGDVEQRRAAGHVVRGQRRERGRHDRHHRGAHAEAHDEERAEDVGVGRVRADLGEHRHAGGDHRDAGQHDLAGADLVGQDAGDRHGDHRAEALRGQQPAGVEGALAADLDEVEREQQRGAEEGDREQAHRDDRDRHVRFLNRRSSTSGWMLRLASAHGTNATISSEADDHRDQHAGGHRGALLGDGADAVEERGEARGEQDHAQPVEGLRRLHVVLGQHDPGVDDRGDADRQVDQEDPVPRGALDERAAEDRAEDRAEQHRDAEHGHHAADALGAGGAGQDRHAERHQHAAAEALEDPVEDQQLQRRGRRAQHGAGGEEQRPRAGRGAWCRSGRPPSRSAG